MTTPGRGAGAGRHRALIALLLALSAVSVAAAADFSSHPIELIVPFAPGGASDVAARVLAAALSKSLSQPVIVVNRPGAGGAVGAASVAHARADGYTLLIGGQQLAVSEHVEAVTGHSPAVTRDQFVGIARLTADAPVLAVGAGASWKTVGDLIQDARRRPGVITYASAGEYGAAHLPMEMLLEAAGVHMTHVPYRGLAPAITDVLGGRVQVIAAPRVAVVPHVRSGALRLLATWSRTRLEAMPAVPTLHELGFPVEYAIWSGLFAPKGTPQSVLATLGRAVRQAAGHADFKGRAAELFTPAYQDADEFNAWWDRDARAQAAIVRWIAKREVPPPGVFVTTASPSPPVASAQPSIAVTPRQPPIAVTPPQPSIAAPPPQPSLAVTPPPAANAPSSASAQAVFGHYHAIVIGNQAYRSLPRLRTPKADAQAVAEVLQRSYAFQQVRLLLDATRADTIRALDEARRALGDDDNLVIYYAGHGYLDRDADRGYWLPVDAESDSRANWLSNADITDTLRAVRARHVVVAADSCYSGTLSRNIGIQPLSPVDAAMLARKRARTVLTSGGLEPVSDVGGGDHSVFARAFLQALTDNDGVADLTHLFAEIRRQVLLNSEQTPQYSDIRQAGHDGGDFIFVRAK